MVSIATDVSYWCFIKVIIHLATIMYKAGADPHALGGGLPGHSTWGWLSWEHMSDDALASPAVLGPHTLSSHGIAPFNTMEFP